MTPLCARPRGRDRPPRPPRLAASVRSNDPDAPMTVAIGINRALDDILRPLSRGHRLRRRRRAKGRRLRGHPRTAQPQPGRRGCSTPCSTSSPSSAWPSVPGCRDCFPSRRSSTSPTCTTPRTRSAARPRRCSSSRTGSTATRWSCASPGTATRRASADTSTTTTRIAAIRDIPGVVIASPVAPRRRRGDVAHLRRRGEDVGCGVHLPRAHRAVPHPRPLRGRRRAVAGDLSRPRACRSAGPEPTATERI